MSKYQKQTLLLVKVRLLTYQHNKSAFFKGLQKLTVTPPTNSQKFYTIL